MTKCIQYSAVELQTNDKYDLVVQEWAESLIRPRLLDTRLITSVLDT